MPVRIYDISKKLGLENKEVLSKAKELGIAAARVASSSLDKITAEYLEEKLRLAYPNAAAPAAPAATPPAPPTPQEPITILSAPPTPTTSGADVVVTEAPRTATVRPAEEEPPSVSAATAAPVSPPSEP